MADINLDDFIRQLEEGNRSLSGLTDGIRGASTSMGSLSAGSALAGAELRREAAIRKQTSEQLKKDFKDLGTDMANSMRGLVGGNTGFSQLANVAASATNAMGSFASGLARLVPIFGEGLGKLISSGSKMMAESLQLATQQFETGYNAFKQAAKIAAVNSFDELRDSSGALNLRMEQLSAVLVTNADNLTAIGGSALQGTNSFKRLANESGQLRKEFMRLGTSVDDLANLQINMMGQFSRAGFGLKDIDKIQRDYLVNLDAISQLTGKSKEQLQKERQQRENEFRFRARMQQLAGSDPKRYAQLQERFDVLQRSLSPEDFRALTAQFGTGGRIMNAQMAGDVVRSPMIRQLLQNLETSSYTELQEQGRAVSQAGIARFGGTAAQTLSQLPFMYQTGEVFDKANLKPVDYEKLKQEREKIRKDEESANSKIAGTADSLQTASVNLQQAATALNSVTTALKFTADSLNKITGYINTTVSGQTSSATASNTGARPASVIGPGGAAFGVYSTAGRRTPQNGGNSQVGAVTTSSPASTGITEDMISPTIPDGLGVNGRQGDLPIKRALQEKLSKIAEQFPGAIITGLNDSDIVNRVGSPHELGEAVDFFISNYNADLSDDYLKKLRDIGFTRVLDEYKFPSPNATGPHLHAALRDGGIAYGPSLAGEAGPEAVVPLPNGRSIPVVLGENGIFQEMLDELQSLRIAMESGLGIQRKQLQFARN
jgi:hypothetical protein